jgi:hypothetical protein
MWSFLLKCGLQFFRMEHTGPGIWTDAVLAYLKARYNVTWHDLRGLQTPLRIGEIMVLPITGKLDQRCLSIRPSKLNLLFKPSPREESRISGRKVKTIRKLPFTTISEGHGRKKVIDIASRESLYVVCSIVAAIIQYSKEV